MPMQCELCHKEVNDGESVVPVGTLLAPETIWMESKGIHVSCLQEITSFVKQISDTLRPNTTNDEETN